MSRLPQITGDEMVRFLKRQGFADRGMEGSHRMLKDPLSGVVIPVPVHKGKTLGRALAFRILRDAGFSVDDYLRLR